MLKARDELKDQTYFLSQIDKKLLSRVLFPVGGLLKAEVRKIAAELGLDRINKKKSSKGICMIGKRNFGEFIDKYLPVNKGSIVDLEKGTVIGEHYGIHHCTVGQRIVVDDKCYSDKRPFFVAKKHFDSNSVFVV
jgi:tRNA U34 2-thiouridine synthase MnmA/TrmU